MRREMLRLLFHTFLSQEQRFTCTIQIISYINRVAFEILLYCDYEFPRSRTLKKINYDSAAE